ncbi:MAG: translation initiation factor IF-2 [Candidatus Omnitrophota bacterium]
MKKAKEEETKQDKKPVKVKAKVAKTVKEKAVGELKAKVARIKLIPKTKTAVLPKPKLAIISKEPKKTRTKIKQVSIEAPDKEASPIGESHISNGVKPEIVEKAAPVELKIKHQEIVQSEIKPQIKHEEKEEKKEETQALVPPVQQKPKEEAPTYKLEVPAETKPKEKSGLQKLVMKFPITVKDLAAKLSVKPNDIILKLMKLKFMATINQSVDLETASLIAIDYGYDLERTLTVEEEVLKSHNIEDKSKLVHRAPVVTLMGHVDHGKTSLLDAIRKSSLTEKESGGITQHIGAYEVSVGKGQITFLDTPGHQAFTAMRARGAQATDIVILVVAADDGVMPQTLEAIDHARAANVPIVVALNKIDKPEANPDKVKKQLMEVGLTPEEWGGKTITVGVSAKTGKGMDELLEMILLEAELLELKADPTKAAKGVVIEGKLSKGGGPVATVLVQNGTLRPGDMIVAGQYFGKVRALINDLVHRVNEAPPSKPVEVLGLCGVPQAGDVFFVVEEDKDAKEIATRRIEEAKLKEAHPVKRITLEDLSRQVKEGKAKELKIILKADAQGSEGALIQSLKGLETKDVRLDIIHSGVGSITESDVMLAAASNAIIIGFHIELTPEAGEKAKLENIDVRIYRIIYEAIADLKNAMEGMLEPHIEEVFIGRAEIRQVFKVSKSGTIAGCFMIKGKATRGLNCRLIRDKVKLFEGKISSLKRFKDDVKEVAEGFECGVSLDKFDAFNVGDLIEIYEIKKTARKL